MIELLNEHAKVAGCWLHGTGEMEGSVPGSGGGSFLTLTLILTLTLTLNLTLTLIG